MLDPRQQRRVVVDVAGGSGRQNKGERQDRREQQA
jgi:hypothetical protein